MSENNNKNFEEDKYLSEDYMGWNKFKDIDIDFHKDIDEILNLGIPKIDLLHQFPAYVGHVNIARYLFLYDLYKKCYNLSGHLADVGIWKGASFLFMAKLIKLFETYNNTQAHGFDWFEGLEPSEEDNVSYSKEYASKYACSYEMLMKLIELQKLKEIAIVHKLDLTKELKGFFKNHIHLRFKMVFIDIGIKEVLEKSLESFWPRIVNGGILIMDHYNVEVSSYESEILEKYIGGNFIRQSPFNRQPTAYVIKEK